MKADGRRGFTLVEILIVTVLGAMVLGAMYQVLVTNQRTYTAQQAQIRGQQTVRAGLEVLFGELREISPQGGDLKVMTQDSLEIRVMRNFGIACEVTYGGTPVVKVSKEGDWFGSGDSVIIFAENDTARLSDDTFLIGTANSVAQLLTCGSRDAQTLAFPGMVNDFKDDSVRAGALVRAFEWYTYGMYQIDGKWYLGRRDPGSPSPVPLVGPLAAGGLRFEYFDADGNTTSDTDEVRQIGVTLVTPGEVRGPGGEMIQDSLTARVFTRN